MKNKTQTDIVMKKTLFTSLTAAAYIAGSVGQERPNIVVFLVDDMGVMDTSVPFLVDQNNNIERHPLNDWYRTPNMERLADQGVRFSTFYAQSVSSPTRASIMTGQNATRHGTTNWINSESNNRTKFGPHDWNWDGLEMSDQIYPAILSEAGYRSIHVGKAHFGHDNSDGANPLNIGFDVNIAGSSIGQPGSYYGEHGYGWIKGFKPRAVPDLEEYHNSDVFLTDALTLEAGKEITKAVEEGVPFYLNMSHYAVHAPFETDPRFKDNYSTEEMSDQAIAFATLIEGMDKSLGDIMDKLEELGVAENTFIIFLGDNGGDAPIGGAEDYGSSAPLRGKKGAKYEGGDRVPFIASWAKPNPNNSFQKKHQVATNFVQTQIGTIMDIYPTVLSIAGLKAPKNHTLDGGDLKRLFSGKKDRRHRDDFLLHFPHEHRSSYFTTYRKGDWKIIYNYNPEKKNDPSYELYNLSTDPYEKNDVASQETKQLRKMTKRMIKQLKREGALYPVDEEGNTLYPQMP